MEKAQEQLYQKKWRLLFKIAGAAAAAILVIIPVQIAVFSIWKIPQGVEAWFALYHSSWLLGLIHQDFLYIINNVLVALMYLAFYVLLKPRNESLMTVALLLGFLGIAAYLGSNKSFEMLQLSNLYYEAGSEVQKGMYLAAGQAMITGWQGTAFNIYYVLNGIALIMIAWVMLTCKVFTKKTALFGLVSGVLMMIPSTAGTVGLVFSLLSLIPWYMFTIFAVKQFFAFSRM